MATLRLSTRAGSAKGNIRRAANIILRGNLVAFPTETVYGLGANAFDPKAVRKIFRAKGRPSDNPLIVHIHALEQVALLADEVPIMFWVLAEKFMPGPLTMVVSAAKRVPSVVTAGLPTVAIRMPDHPVARALLRSSGVPIVAPSANVSGRPSPTTAQHVLDDLDGKIAAVLDGGRCRIGLESTVLDVTKRVPVILRPGAVTKEQIETVLRLKVKVARPTHHRPASPGMKYVHYAPKAEVILFEGERREVWRAMRSAAIRLSNTGLRIGVLAEQRASALFPTKRFYSLGSTGVEDAARKLFSGFRKLDADRVDMILCQGFGPEDLGRALMNRLTKAATRRVRV